MIQKVVIGSRESKLAVMQSEIVMEYLRGYYSGIEVSLITMKTTGDRILDRNLDEIGGKGLFVKELEHALRERMCDFCVHSLKDMPMEIPKDLPIVCFSKREDPRDVLVLPDGVSEPDFSKPIGTSSARRTIQLKQIYPDATFESIRGNVQTRLRKLDEGQYGGIILAAAGLKRLGLEHRISRYFSVDEVLPAAGQGILAIQGRAGSDDSLFDNFTDESATSVAIAERAFIRQLNGGCSSPSAAHAYIDNGLLTIKGLYIDDRTTHMYYGEMSGPMQDADYLGMNLAKKLIEQERGK